MDELDPKGLMADAFVIEDLSEADARAILLEWAIGLPDGVGHDAALRAILSRHDAAPLDHPMRRLLVAGLESGHARRRGGALGRRGAR